MVDTFIKVAVSCKTKPPVYGIKEAKALLSRLSHEDFRSQLLPAVQKAMLRNPEIILPCLSYIISGLSLDLSQYALDITKSITRKKIFCCCNFVVLERWKDYEFIPNLIISLNSKRGVFSGDVGKESLPKLYTKPALLFVLGFNQ